MVDMAFVKKVFANYEKLYVENCGQSLEYLVTENHDLKKKIMDI